VEQVQLGEQVLLGEQVQLGEQVHNTKAPLSYCNRPVFHQANRPKTLTLKIVQTDPRAVDHQ